MFQKINNLGIRTKLIVLFILIKIIPLLVITYIAIIGVFELESILINDTEVIKQSGRKAIENTARISIQNSIDALDKKSQNALERLTVEVANQISQFLHERDKDLVFLSNMKPSQKTYADFFKSKTKKITTHENYVYDDTENKWVIPDKPDHKSQEVMKADLVDNAREFNHVQPDYFQKISIPLYKEISFYNLDGQEIYKVSALDKRLKNIKFRKNTYINAETYYQKSRSLKKGEIYVSEVIGAYVPSKVVGFYTKEKTKQLGIPFEPEKSGYAGLENPVGKKFEAIIRFVTPVFDQTKKIGYLTMALDHTHIMEYSDYIIPTEQSFSNISDGSKGNYAFIWDHKGRNISHVRDYFIAGYDPKTGQRVPGWISENLAQRWKKSNIRNLSDFLKTVTPYENQSLKNKGYSQDVKNGNLGLDCRYLNHAPQCQGWHQLTADGGHGSFIIFWSGVWKLTTAATIPYYTGQYGGSRRGFGFVTIGANVEEFHKAADKTKHEVDSILKKQTGAIQSTIEKNKKQMMDFISNMVNQLTFSTLAMIVIVVLIAIILSASITKKIKVLIQGTKEFSQKRLNYRIEVTSEDEIGELSKAFNQMAHELNKYQYHLEELIQERTKELNLTNDELKNEIIVRKQTEQELIEIKQKAELANQSKSEFLANMSHELRTPMQGILGFAHLGMDRSHILSREKVKEFFGDINTSGKRLLTLLNDLLDLSKLESGKVRYHMAKHRLTDLVEVVLSEFSTIINDKKLKIEFNQPDFESFAYCDQDKIIQVIRNLLSNAIKFSDPGKEISISITKRHKQIIFKIEDEGIGIPDDELNTIFDEFIQSSKSKTGAGGTGLGLAICKEIIKNHRGEIWAENNQKNGATLTFYIPKDRRRMNSKAQ